MFIDIMSIMTTFIIGRANWHLTTQNNIQKYYKSSLEKFIPYLSDVMEVIEDPKIRNIQVQPLEKIEKIVRIDWIILKQNYRVATHGYNVKYKIRDTRRG